MITKKNNKNKIFLNLLFNFIRFKKIKLTKLKLNKNYIGSVETPIYPILLNTGRFFKSFNFIFFGLNNFLFKKYKSVTLKSLTHTLWDSLDTNFINI